MLNANNLLDKLFFYVTKISLSFAVACTPQQLLPVTAAEKGPRLWLL